MVRFFHSQPRLKTENLLKQQGELLGRIADLLEEGFTFRDALIILLPHHTEEVTKARNIAEGTFRSGKGVTEVLEALGVERKTLLPIAIAEEHGRLITAFQVVAIHFKRREEIRNRTEKLVAYPLVLFAFMGILFFLFRTIFLPNMQQLGESRGSVQEGDFAALSGLLLKVPDFLLITAVCIATGSICFWKWLHLKTGTERLKILLLIPGVSYWVKLILTSSFAREVGTMLETGMSLQDSLDLLKKQDRHISVQLVAEQVRRRIVEGERLSEAVHMKPFRSDFMAFVEHGETGGHLGREMIIYSELLETKMEQAGLRAIGILQPFLFSLLAICILAAYLAILLPMYELLNTM